PRLTCSTATAKRVPCSEDRGKRSGRRDRIPRRRTMRTMTTWLSGITVVVALGFALAGAPLAQTQTTIDVLQFEVVAVDGNTLVVRDQAGTHAVTVPDDFRFDVDGKKLSVSE